MPPEENPSASNYSLAGSEGGEDRSPSDVDGLMEILRLGDVRGPLPAFTHVHVVYALMLIQKHSKVGRKKLSELLGLGEGSVRTLLQKLSRLGLVTATRGGYGLSKRGFELLSFINSKIVRLTELRTPMPWKSPHNTGLVVRGGADVVTSGIIQRDASIRYGAEEALILTCLGDGLHMPGVSNLSKEHPDFAEQITSSLQPAEGDVVIIAGARDALVSRYAALGAALTLLRSGGKS